MELKKLILKMRAAAGMAIKELTFGGDWGTAKVQLTESIQAANQVLTNTDEKEPLLLYPAEASPAIQEVLGLMCFETGGLAHAYRDAGENIPRKVEAEQAFVLHRMLLHALKAGPDWRQSFAEEIKPVLEKADANIKARNPKAPS